MVPWQGDTHANHGTFLAEVRDSPLAASGIFFALLMPRPLHAQDPYPGGLYADLSTTRGLIVISLDFQRTPVTTASFVGLAEGAIRNRALPEGAPFFDGTAFHRVVPGHVVQAGIPPSDLAREPGYSLPNEIHPDLGHRWAGMVGMANGGPHTGTCQWYITLGDRSHLDGDYTVFGEVVVGMDVAQTIVQGDVVETVRIVRVGEEAQAFQPNTELFHRIRTEMAEEVQARESRDRQEKEAYLRRSWPQAVVSDAGWWYVVLHDGIGVRPVPSDTLNLRYSGRTVSGGVFASVSPGGAPGFLPPGAENGEVFRFVVGETEVNRGFDEAVAQMRAGEKRLLIVPPELGYDPVGFYGEERAGEPRFVLRPRSFLISEVEVMK
ncbi:peptidylprolyl isomerase [Gemmatimonadota bacterium]